MALQYSGEYIGIHRYISDHNLFRVSLTSIDDAEGQYWSDQACEAGGLSASVSFGMSLKEIFHNSTIIDLISSCSCETEIQTTETNEKSTDLITNVQVVDEKINEDISENFGLYRDIDQVPSIYFHTGKAPSCNLCGYCSTYTPQHRSKIPKSDPVFLDPGQREDVLAFHKSCYLEFVTALQKCFEMGPSSVFATEML